MDAVGKSDATPSGTLDTQPDAGPDAKPNAPPGNIASNTLKGPQHHGADKQASREDDALKAHAALSFDGVSVTYRVKGEPREVLRDISLHIQAGECYGLVGESGCGKSTVALAALAYLPRGGAARKGQIRIAGKPIDRMDATALRHMRAHDVSMVYQDAARALNPSITVGRQLTEAFVVSGASSAEADARAHTLLQRVQIDQPSRVMRSYPHELSGGMQQRVVIAMALAPRPSLLILDEPTTGLDATVEAEILSLLRSIRAEYAIAMLFISHDLGVIESMCDRVGVLYAGELVEEAEARTLFSAPKHPYTAGLLACLPRGHSRQVAGRPLMTIPGALPDIGRRPAACIFADRCSLMQPRCLSDPPPLYRIEDTSIGTAGIHTSRCHFHDKVHRYNAFLPDGISATDTRADSEVYLATDATDQSVDALPDASSTDLPGTSDNTAGAAQAKSTAPSRFCAVTAPVLSVDAISKSFVTRDGVFKALDDVSFDIGPGETLGLVGESGSGKTTLAKLLLGLEKPDTPGGLAIDGVVLADHVTRRSVQHIRALQVVFQNPDGALNRAWTVRKLIVRSIVKLTPASSRPTRWRLRLPWGRTASSSKQTQVSTGTSNNTSANAPSTGASSDENALMTLINAVRLPERFLDARAAELSGGLKQRVAIARAFAGAPRLIVCDEPTSALDVSVQAAILNLLGDLQRQNDVSYLFISHDMDVVRYLADRIAVLYKGKIVEIGKAEDVFTGPHHPYTAQLLDAARQRGAQSASSSASSDLPAQPSTEAGGRLGCPFYTRCSLRIDGTCNAITPPERVPHAAHRVACHLPVSQLPQHPSA